MSEVLVSATLNVSRFALSEPRESKGEVAEWPKAAVCTKIRLSAPVSFPSKSKHFNNFSDRAIWLLLAALEVPFWEAYRDISGPVLAGQSCPFMSNIDNIRY
jgi:hypothetical protein